MGQKVHPKAYRLPYLFKWNSPWCNKKNYQKLLEEDTKIRDILKESLEQGAVDSIVIKRAPGEAKVTIKTARPGIVIGRGGETIQALKKKVNGSVDSKAQIEVEEINQPQTHAQIVAQNIAEQLARRIPFRRVTGQIVEQVYQQKDIKGIKIQVAGRLNGADMSRTEGTERGQVPLNTIRANIDFAQEEASTKYGPIGVKVWLYKGEEFDVKSS